MAVCDINQYTHAVHNCVLQILCNDVVLKEFLINEMHVVDTPTGFVISDEKGVFEVNASHTLDADADTIRALREECAMQGDLPVQQCCREAQLLYVYRQTMGTLNWSLTGDAPVVNISAAFNIIDDRLYVMSQYYGIQGFGTYQESTDLDWSTIGSGDYAIYVVINLSDGSRVVYQRTIGWDQENYAFDFNTDGYDEYNITYLRDAVYSCEKCEAGVPDFGDYYLRGDGTPYELGYSDAVYDYILPLRMDDIPDFTFIPKPETFLTEFYNLTGDNTLLIDAKATSIQIIQTDNTEYGILENGLSQTYNIYNHNPITLTAPNGGFLQHYTLTGSDSGSDMWITVTRRVHPVII